MISLEELDRTENASDDCHTPHRYRDRGGEPVYLHSFSKGIAAYSVYLNK